MFDVTLRNWQRQSAVRQRGAEDFRPAQWPGCVTDKAALTAAIRTIRGQAAHANKMATRPATVRHTSPNTYTIAASAKGKLSSQNRISPREPRGELTCFRGLVCIAVVQIQSYRARACRLPAPASKRALLVAAASRAARLHAVNCSTAAERAAQRVLRTRTEFRLFSRVMQCRLAQVSQAGVAYIREAR